MWLEQPLPESRQDVARLLDGMVEWLRDVAVCATNSSGAMLHPEHAAALRRQAVAVDTDRCLVAAMELIALRGSLEQFSSPRLVASMAREHWLSLTQSIVHSP